MIRTLKIALFLFSFSMLSYSQLCDDYYNYSKFVNCRQCFNSYYKIYMRPKHVLIGIHDTLSYNVAFTGNRDYIISFCADQMYYPLNIRLFEQTTMKELYDNAKSDYKESIKVGINNTQNILIKLTLLADNPGQPKITKTDACVGLILQYRKLKKNRINDL